MTFEPSANFWSASDQFLLYDGDRSSDDSRNPQRAYNASRNIDDPPLSLLLTTSLALTTSSHIISRLHAPQRAQPVLLLALSDLDAAQALSGKERQRRLAVLLQLGRIAETLGDLNGAEGYLTRAVEEGLGDGYEKVLAEGRGGQTLADVGELPTPTWIERTDFGSIMEALGSLYEKMGKPE